MLNPPLTSLRLFCYKMVLEPPKSGSWCHIESASSGRPLTEEIARDHETLKQCYEQYKNAPNAEEKEKWKNQFTWTNARHAIAEELVVYPAMDKKMGQEGRDITDKDRDSHQRIKEVSKAHLCHSGRKQLMWRRTSARTYTNCKTCRRLRKSATLLSRICSRSVQSVMAQLLLA